MRQPPKNKTSQFENQKFDSGLNRQISRGPKNIPPFDIIKDELNRVRSIIDKNLVPSADKKALGNVLSAFKFSTGKMFRPALLILSYLVARQNLPEKTTSHYNKSSEQKAIRLAAVVEMIHNATLIHDDVIDHAKSRRSMPTLNAVWGNESAVLLGDFLLSRVFKISAELHPQIIKIFADAASRTCEGELTQMAQTKNWNLSENDYLVIISDKTAALFRCCCHLGSILANPEPNITKSLIKYGENAGVAFQITDDLLDIIASKTETGKAPGSDLDKKKLTLPLIHLMRQADIKTKKRIKDTLLNGKLKSETLLNFLESFGSIDYSRRQAQKYITNAVDALDNFTQSAEKDALIRTARYIAARTD